MVKNNFNVVYKTKEELLKITLNIFNTIRNDYLVGLDDYYDWRFYVVFDDGSYVLYIPTVQDTYVEDNFYKFVTNKYVNFILIISNNYEIQTNNKDITKNKVNNFVHDYKILSDYTDDFVKFYERIN